MHQHVNKLNMSFTLSHKNLVRSQTYIKAGFQELHTMGQKHSAFEFTNKANVTLQHHKWSQPV